MSAINNRLVFIGFVLLLSTLTGVAAQYASQSHPWSEIFCSFDSCISGSDIADGSVTASKIKDNSILPTDIKDNSLGPIDFQDFKIIGQNIKDRTLKDEDLNRNYIGKCSIKTENHYSVSCDTGKIALGGGCEGCTHYSSSRPQNRPGDEFGNNIETSWTCYCETSPGTTPKTYVICCDV